MKKKEINRLADEILSDVRIFSKAFMELRKAVEDFLVSVMSNAKKKSGQIPDEESFLKLIAVILRKTVIDKAIPKPFGFIIKILGLTYFVLKQIDRYILDNLFGSRWFEKIKKLIK